MRKRARTRPLTVGGIHFSPGAAGEVELDAGQGGVGSRLRVPVRLVRGARPGPRLAILAGLRGSEVSAIQAARELGLRVDPDRLAGDLLVAPLLEVSAFLHPQGPSGGRLDRSFPGDPRGAAAARHAHAIFQEVVMAADMVVVLGAPVGRRVAMPHVRTDLDAPGALPLAQALGASLVVHDRGRPGSLLRAALEAGRAAVRFDLGALRQLDRETVDGALASLFGLLRAYEMLPGPAPRRPRPTLVRAIEKVRAPRAGVIELLAAPGQFVRAGDAVAAVRSAWGADREAVLAPCTGLVIATTARAIAVAGTPLVLLGRGVRRPPPPLLRSATPRTRIGWSEWVALPDLGAARLKAKIDTGARTCALHVTGLRRVGEDGRGRPVVEFLVPTGSRPRLGSGTLARAAVVEMVSVRDSGGRAERRPVIETTLEIGPVRRRVRVTLTNRGEMLFPMLVGRTGLGGDFVVDVGGRYLLGRLSRSADGPAGISRKPL